MLSPCSRGAGSIHWKRETHAHTAHSTHHMRAPTRLLTRTRRACVPLECFWVPKRIYGWLGVCGFATKAVPASLRSLHTCLKPAIVSNVVSMIRARSLVLYNDTCVCTPVSALFLPISDTSACGGALMLLQRRFFLWKYFVQVIP